MTLNKDLIEYLRETKLSLEEFYILYCKYYSNGWLFKYKPISLVYNSLISKKLISGKTNQLLKSGEEIISNYLKKVGNVVDLTNSFEEFWELFPANDSIAYFKQTRVLKRENVKDKCKILFYSHWRDSKDILKGLKNEIRLRQENTQRKNDNQFTYMLFIERWLKQEEWLNWLDNEENKGTYEDIIE